MRKILTVSSLDKVFPNEPPQLLQTEYSVFRNEAFHYQAAVYTDDLITFCGVEIETEISEYITVRRVEPMPAHLATRKNFSDDYLLKTSGDSTLYPELLKPLRQGAEILRQNVWTSFWVTVNHEEKQLPAGRYAIKLIINNPDGDVLSTEFTLNVLDADLPKSALQYTDWFHYDSISHYYGEEPFTEKYYAYLNEFIKTAVGHGMTMLYTPLFTPTLDTKEGWERKTTQLVGVTVTGEDAYAFDLSRLAYFMENALRLGVQKFELSHLSTQWGAFFCPKVEAVKDGKTVKLFGWETFASSTAYLTFLDAFMSAFQAFITEKGYGDKIVFHVSDEPQKEHVNNFVYQKNIIRKYFPNAKIMDALSSVEFVEEGVVDIPVVSTDEAEKFREKGLLSWVYYCTIQGKNYLSNRFFNMPSQRNRVLGFQLYENGVEGFLHWGFNFYNSYLSLYPIDPYVVTDAGGVYQSGDCFIVYPDKNGVLESLRLEVFYDGINDYRALCLLEKLYGKDFTLALLRGEGVRGFSEYPRSATWHLAFREKINCLIADKLKK